MDRTIISAATSEEELESNRGKPEKDHKDEKRDMPKLTVPTPANIQAAHNFLVNNDPFATKRGKAVLELHSGWLQLDPLSLSMIAAWGGWCKRQGLPIKIENLGRQANYAARMKLFQHLGVEHSPEVSERGEMVVLDLLPFTMLLSLLFTH
ncbi:MAG TPA: hypothetical protein VFZ34_16910 [Blastocatellia bacterium]|nr:hypothetical protein [Blastocatellia bacterium]